MAESTRETLIEQIKTAFAAVPAPEGSENGAAGKAWRELGVDVLLREHEKLPVFSTAAYSFYLPAYLLGVLEQFDALDMHEVPARLVRSLAPPKDYQNRLAERVAALTPEQRQAVYDFLLFYKTLYPAESWRYFPEDKSYLDAATKFWKDAAAPA